MVDNNNLDTDIKQLFKRECLRNRISMREKMEELILDWLEKLQNDVEYQKRIAYIENPPRTPLQLKSERIAKLMNIQVGEKADYKKWDELERKLT